MFLFGCARFIPLRLVFLPHILCARKMYWKYNFNTQRRRQPLRPIFPKLLKFFRVCIYLWMAFAPNLFRLCGHSSEFLQTLDFCFIYQYALQHKLFLFSHFDRMCTLRLPVFIWFLHLHSHLLRFGFSKFVVFHVSALLCAYLFYVDISSVASIEITFRRDSVDTSYDYGTPKLNRGSENCVCILQVFK